MQQSYIRGDYLINKFLSIMTHSMGIGMVSVVLFFFGFYVIPVFADTSLQLYDSFK